VGLAVWVRPEQHAALLAAVDARIGRGKPAAPLADVRVELDAAPIRSRWFQSGSAVGLRRIAGWGVNAVEMRVSPTERAELLACDLDPEMRRAVEGPPDPSPPLDHADREPAQTSWWSGEPVALLTEHNGELAWTVGVSEGGHVLASQPPPEDDAVWTAAWQAAGRLEVKVEELAGARRLVTPADPALATAALARTDLRSLPADSALVLRLPDVAVIAPVRVAARIALHAYPVRVRVVHPATLPPYPLR
jgi:hypothetical protein